MFINEKVANRKLENLGNLWNIIPSFLISKFSILPYSQNRVSEFSEISECSEFSTWPRESLYRKSYSLQTNVKIIELHVVHKSRPWILIRRNNVGNNIYKKDQ